jgi:GTP-binding protein
MARTSAAPGKTRLANVYRVGRGSAAPFYLVDLPGYGYARGGAIAASGFEELTREYFSRGIRLQSRGIRRQPDLARREAVGLQPDATNIAALLLIDVRHPGLDSDRAAWQWLQRAADVTALVGTKIDKLARGQRIRALRELESVFEDSVLPVSVVTGEGLDELWKLIDSLPAANNRNINPRSNQPSMPRKGTAPRHQKK